MATWHLFAHLRQLLVKQTCGADARKKTTLWDFYERWYRPFGQLLSEIEELGIRVDTAHLTEQLARSEADLAQNRQARVGYPIGRFASQFAYH